MKEEQFETLSESYQLLLNRAEEALCNSYSPYSSFLVGAAILTADGSIITGTNVENAAYGTICAERSAIVAANASGQRQFKAIGIIARARDRDLSEVTAPCGSCRQALFEFSQLTESPLEVVMANSRKTRVITASIEELLPLAFGIKDLGLDVSEYRTAGLKPAGNE